MIDTIKVILLFLAIYVIGKGQYDFLSWVANKIVDKLMGPPSLASKAPAHEREAKLSVLRPDAKKDERSE